MLNDLMRRRAARGIRRRPLDIAIDRGIAGGGENIQANAADLTAFDSWRFDHAPLSHYAGFERARAAFVVFTKGRRTERVMFLHADFDGFKLDANHDQTIEADDFPDLIAACRSSDERWRDWRLRDPAAPWTKKWWFADADAIEREDWNLSAARYRPESCNAAEHRDTRELLAELHDDVAAILGDVEALAAELGERAA